MVIMKLNPKIMKKLLIHCLVALTFFCVQPPLSFAKDVYVQGYTRKDGTYVQPHYRSAPDGNFNNNWSTEGNINPYTGEVGTKQYPQYNNGLQLPPAPVNNQQSPIDSFISGYQQGAGLAQGVRQINQQNANLQEQQLLLNNQNALLEKQKLLNQLVLDPKFTALDDGSKKKILSTNFPEFLELSDSQQSEAISQINSLNLKQDNNISNQELPTKKGLPYAIKTKWPGLVKSPYATDKTLVDVSTFPSGSFARCPHTAKTFVIP